MKYSIMQHCFGTVGSGGPIIAFERLLANSHIEYSQIRQTEPARGINLALIRRFVREIKDAKPDLIHIRGLGNEGFHAVVAARLARVPRVLVSIHGTHRDLTQHGSLIRHWIVIYILENLTLLFAHRIATVCRFASQRNFLRLFRSKFVGFVSNGVEVPHTINKKSEELRTTLGIQDSIPIGLCVSRITLEKGYLVLAEALKKLDNQQIDPFAVVVVGGGNDSIKAHFEGIRNIRVCFVGHQQNVAYYMASSHFFIFPSLHENLSNALIEAMSYRLPVIASNVGGNSEVVEGGGGLLVPVSDADCLAQAIQQFVVDPDLVERLGMEAQANIRHHYSIQHMVDGWEKIYMKILEERNA